MEQRSKLCLASCLCLLIQVLPHRSYGVDGGHFRRGYRGLQRGLGSVELSPRGHLRRHRVVRGELHKSASSVAAAVVALPKKRNCVSRLQRLQIMEDEEIRLSICIPYFMFCMFSPPSPFPSPPYPFVVRRVGYSAKQALLRYLRPGSGMENPPLHVHHHPQCVRILQPFR